MKKIVLISSFCDTEVKLQCLKKNILKIKELGLDVMVSSPIVLDEEIIKISDYVFYTKDNPVLDWPEKAILYWKEFFYENSKYIFSRTVPDYGWAGFHQVKQLSEIALGMNYDYYYHIIYDLKIDHLKECFEQETSKKIFPSKREETTWNYGLHFMIFDKKNLKLFSDLITKELYLKFNKGNAFDCLESIAHIMNCERGEKFAEDEIYYFEDKDFFNSSPTQDFGLFIENNDQQKTNTKLWFFNLLNEIQITLIVNGIEINKSINNFDNVDLGMNKIFLRKVEMIYSSQLYDLTDIIEKVKHSTTQIL